MYACAKNTNAKRKKEDTVMENKTTLKSEMIVLLQKRVCDQRSKINQLEQDVRFLKTALAIALKECHGTIVMRENTNVPEFALEENIEGEIIIKLIQGDVNNGKTKT